MPSPRNRPRRAAARPPGGGKKTDLRDFIAKRTDSVLAQLDGKVEGKVLTGGFGPGGGKGGFGLGNMLAKPIVEAVDTNKDGKLSLDEFKIAAGKLFKEAGGDEKTPVGEEALIETINRLIPPPKGFGGFKAPKGFGRAKASPRPCSNRAMLVRTRNSAASSSWSARETVQAMGQGQERRPRRKDVDRRINQSILPPSARLWSPPSSRHTKKDAPGKELPKEKRNE